MKLYLGLKRMDHQVQITLRHSIANTQFTQGKTVIKTVENDKINEVLLNLLKLTVSQLKNTDLNADIRFKGDSSIVYF